jgi:hypothetical protein
MSGIAQVLHRWSRRKAGLNDEGQGPTPERKDATPPDLPPVECLDAEADFAPFMSRAVPAGLRKAALRRLWRLDPGFGRSDGMNDYDEDFNDPARTQRLIRTAYRIGCGMLAEDRPGASTPEETPAEAHRQRRG